MPQIRFAPGSSGRLFVLAVSLLLVTAVTAFTVRLGEGAGSLSADYQTQHTVLTRDSTLHTLAPNDPTPDDWESYLGDVYSSQYSGLEQINKSNAHRLEVAWTYESGGADTVNNRTQILCNPLVIDGVLYGTSPRINLFALDAANGQQLWRFNPFQSGEGPSHLGVNRGVMFWEDGKDRRILYTAGDRLYAINATTACLCKVSERRAQRICAPDWAQTLIHSSSTPTRRA